MASIKVGDLTRLFRPLPWQLTTYFGRRGFLRLKSKPSGRSLVTPEGGFQLSGRVFVVDHTGGPQIVPPKHVDNGRLVVEIGDEIYMWLTLWMTDNCHVHVVRYPDGSIVAHSTAEREGDAVKDAWKQLRARHIVR